MKSTVLSVSWIFKCNSLLSPLIPKWSSTSVLYAIVIHFKTVLLLTFFLDFFIWPLRPTSRPLELGGPFRLFFWKKYWEIVGFFKKISQKWVIYSNQVILRLFHFHSFGQTESYYNIHIGFVRNSSTICIHCCRDSRILPGPQHTSHVKKG